MRPDLFTAPTLKAFDATIFRFPQDAFDDAIKAGRLSADPHSPLFAGNYMYMGTRDDRDTFKHIDTRAYL